MDVIKKIITVKLFIAFIYLIAAIIFSPASFAQQLPLWEFGIGFGALHLPFYRGADTTSNLVVPFPYLVYRGDWFKIDESGVHHRLFLSDRAKLELSLSGGVPVPSGDTDSLRAGMPDLDPTVEFGPSLEINLWENERDKRSLWMNLPLRATVSADSSITISCLSHFPRD